MAGPTAAVGHQAWLVLAVGDDRQHGGNDGYDDNPAVHYSWDSTVPNHAQLNQGDQIAIWDKRSLLGVSVIESITRATDIKDRYTCPSCGLSTIKRRRTLLPPYKCYTCKEEFSDPVATPAEVITYRTKHDVGWVDLGGTLSGPELRALCVVPGSQLSLRRLRWGDFRLALEGLHRSDELTVLDEAASMIAGGHRRRVVRVRVGQAAFRRRLLSEFGECCALSGPAPAAALEAAHLYSYAEVGEHHDHGGLLLRRDLHRLFDLGFLAIDPDSGRVDVSAALKRFPAYAPLENHQVTVQLSAQSRRWLELHWQIHRVGLVRR